MKRIGSSFLMMVIVLLAGCNEDEKKDTILEKEQLPSGTMATGLKEPWSIQKVDESIWISERSGAIVYVQDGKQERQSLHLAKTLSSQAEAGLLGFQLDPNFLENKQAYVYYSYEEKGSILNRVVSIQLDNGAWKEKDVLIDRIPSGSVHHGGRLKIGLDEKLYITTGDGHEEKRSQTKDSLGGKILRLNLDGTIPDNNPFASSPVYSYGHRNPQGLAWDEQGELYASEHGPSGHDELNLIEPGQNYGWPDIVGDETKKGMKTPIYHVGDNTWAPSGIDFHNGQLYVAALAGRGIKQYDLKTGTVQNFVDGGDRIRDIYIEENTLYYITNNTDGRGNPAKGDDRLVKVTLAE